MGVALGPDDIAFRCIIIIQWSNLFSVFSRAVHRITLYIRRISIILQII
jgi:hypothetical protein